MPVAADVTALVFAFVHGAVLVFDEHKVLHKVAVMVALEEFWQHWIGHFSMCLPQMGSENLPPILYGLISGTVGFSLAVTGQDL